MELWWNKLHMVMMDGSSLTNNPCNAYKSFFFEVPGFLVESTTTLAPCSKRFEGTQRPQVMFAASEPPILDGSSESICQTGRRARWDEGKLWQSPKALKTQKRCAIHGPLAFFGGCDLVIGMRILWIHILSTGIFIFIHMFLYMFLDIWYLYKYKRSFRHSVLSSP